MSVNRLLCSIGLSLLLLTAVSGVAHAYTTSLLQTQTISGQNFTFAWVNLPTLASGNVTIHVDLVGDYDDVGGAEYAAITADGAALSPVAQGSATYCDAAGSRQSYTIAASNIADHALNVLVDLSTSVDPICATNSVRVTVQYTALPDLQVSALAAPVTGDTNGHNSMFTATYTVTNAFEGFTTDFSVAFYYCPTNVYSASCALLGTQAITDNFAVTQARAYVSPTLTLPDSVEHGARFLLARVDSAAAITENNETNNERTAAITISSWPDLFITGSIVPTTPGTLNPGSAFTGTYTVSAADNASAVYTDFVMYYFYCPNAVPAGCVQIGQQTITTNIMSGGSTTFTTPSLTIPATATNGTHYIRAWADATFLVNESDGTNNQDYGAIFIGTGAPNLTVDQLTVPLTGGVSAAASTFTMSYRLRNTTTTAFTTDFVVRFYYCTLPVGGTCYLFGTQTVTQDFASLANVVVTSPTLTMPNYVVVGQRSIRVFADATGLVAESDETDNVDSATIAITAKPDLTIAAVTVPFTGNTTGPGSPFTGRLTITNKAATSAFTTDFAVQYFYCPNANTTGCIGIGQDNVVTNFNASGALTYTTTTVTIPASASPGAHFLRAWVDSGNTVDEGDETNNNLYAPITLTTGSPDIYVKTFTATVAGQTVSYSIEVCNQGGATTANFILGLYYNRATAPDCTATTADQTSTVTGGLAANACKVVPLTQTNAAAGTTTAWAFGDQACTLVEGDNNNNTKSVAVTVATPPDMGVAKDGKEPDVGKQDGKTPPDTRAPDVLSQPDVTKIPDLGRTDKGPPGGDQGTPEVDQATTKVDKGTTKVDKGTTTVDTGTTTGDTGSTTDTGGTTGDRGTKGDGATKPPSASGGCSCRVDDRSENGGMWVLGLLLGAMALVQRRRRR